MRWLFKAYESVLHRYPLVTQSVQTGVLVAAGDVISQVFVEKQKNLNYKRTLQFFTVGTLYVGPALTLWYRFLHRTVGSGGKDVAIKKVALDQICFAPFVLLGFVFLANTMQGKNFAETKTSLKNTYPDILKANYKLWPAAQLINFYFVPLHFQVLYVQVIALFWNTYICYKTRPE